MKLEIFNYKWIKYELLGLFTKYLKTFLCSEEILTECDTYFVKNRLALKYRRSSFFSYLSEQNYNLLVGSIKMKIKIIKNEKNESILNIAVLFDEENAEGKEKKNEIIYRFNPFMDKMPVTIGRINCDINLNNISVSKLHAQIDYIYDYDEYFIIDCKSTNGTYLLLKNPLNSIYVKRELHLKLFESKFKIQYVNFDN